MFYLFSSTPVTASLTSSIPSPNPHTLLVICNLQALTFSFSVASTNLSSPLHFSLENKDVFIVQYHER